RVVHKSTGRALGFAQAVAAMGDDAEFDRSVERLPAVLVFDESDWLADQRFADVNRVSLPPDLAVVTHAPDRVIGAVVRLAQHSVEAPRRGGVMLGRRLIAQSLVRAFFVVETLEG